MIYQLLDHTFIVGYYSEISTLQSAAEAYYIHQYKQSIASIKFAREFSSSVVSNDRKLKFEINDHLFTVVEIPLDHYFNTFYDRCSLMDKISTPVLHNTILSVSQSVSRNPNVQSQSNSSSPVSLDSKTPQENPSH